MYCTDDEALFTYINEFTGSRSKLDNFIISENLSSHVCRYYSINKGDNLSYHIPIVVDITLSIEYLNDIQKIMFLRKASRGKATPGQIVSSRDLLSNLLDGIEIPIQAMYCKNMFCKYHNSDIDTYYSFIITSCIKAISQCIPRTSKPKIEGWNDNVKPYKEQSVFWH